MKKKFLGLICITYFILILLIFIRGYLGNYLAPQMHKYILSAAMVLLIIGIVVIFSKKIDYSFKFSDLVLFLPIIMFIFAGDGKLSTMLASNRASGFDSKKIVVDSNKNKDKDKDKDNDNENISSSVSNHDYNNIPVVPDDVKNNTTIKTTSTNKVDYDIVDEVYSTFADVITFNKHPEKIVGKTIRIRGFTMLNNDMFSKEYFAIGKYVVSCCVADSGFGGFVAKYDDMSKIKDNSWYEIEGVLELAKTSYGTDMVVININNIKELDEKKEQLYVYPCYSYGDGSCSAFDNFDIEIEY